LIQRLETDFGAASSPHRAVIREANREIDRLRAIAERLDLVAELEAGGLSPTREPADLNEIVRHTIEHTLALDAREGVTVSYSGPERPCIVLGDRGLLARAIAELLKNGVVHAHARVQVTIEPSNAETALFVDDDGEGFSSAPDPSIFERFARRSSDEPADKPSGTGIGLSLARDVMAAHGGRLFIGPSSLPPRGKTRGARLEMRFVT
jgi:signal transduction histidine kinase